MSKLREMREKILSKKDNKGFTLVELIVVIVILAILVGVTIGGVYGYVNKSRVNTDINNASAITSTLSTMTTVKGFSNSTVKDKVATITWSDATPATSITISDAAVAALANDGKTIVNYIAELLPDGLPEAKTAGASYKLEMKWDDKGNFQSVKCTAYDGADGSGSALEAQE